MIPVRFRCWLRQRAREIAARSPTRILNGVIAAGNLLFPPVCTFCGAEMESGGRHKPMLCRVCLRRLVASQRERCRRCASPLPKYWPQSGRCPRCLARRYHFDGALALGDYQADMQQAVLRMKRPAFEPLTRSMGLLVAEMIARHRAQDLPDLVVSVPMHWRRRLARGTSTAGILGATVAEALGLPTAKWLLRCRRKTRKQGMLRPRERVRNVRDAFCISAGYDITDHHVMLVDDIMTTGATASEAAKVLRDAGAAVVDVAVVARGIGEA